MKSYTAKAKLSANQTGSGWSGKGKDLKPTENHKLGKWNKHS